MALRLAGAGLVAVADIAVAADDTTLGFSEVKLGLIPAVIAPHVLAKIGQSAARELFITGRRFDAAHASTSASCMLSFPLVS
jgi:methylglutaconyl-CoA hydratase